jgi:hypothetical protein
MPRVIPLLLFATSSWLTGCQSLPASLVWHGDPAPVFRSGDPGGDAVVRLLRDALALDTLAPAERASRRRAAERALRQDDTPANRLRLALALSATDVERARGLLVPVAGDTTAEQPELAALAAWLLADWQQEQRRRQQQLEALVELRERNATLERQLQEIRSIEQQLERRNRPAIGAGTQ